MAYEKREESGARLGEDVSKSARRKGPSSERERAEYGGCGVGESFDGVVEVRGSRRAL